MNIVPKKKTMKDYSRIAHILFIRELLFLFNLKRIRRPDVPKIASVFLILVSLSGCMTSPYDQQRVADTNSNLSFEGYVTIPNSTIPIKAYSFPVFNFGYDSWSVIGTTQAASSGVNIQGSTRYLWQHNLAIPPKYWEPGITGYQAWVKAPGVSVEADWFKCFSRNMGINDFYKNCRAPQSPIARVYTENYAGVDAGCTPEATELVDLVNDYRAASGKPRIPIDPSLCAVAQAHTVDLVDNSPDADYSKNDNTTPNAHSWSDQGDWSECTITDGSATEEEFQCLWDKPRELTSYTGNGYENAYWSSAGATPAGALNQWKNSSPHNRTMLNLKDPDPNGPDWSAVTYKGIGAGIYGNYAVLWFGD